MSFYVYVLVSKKDSNFYTGYTNNLAIRLQEHRTGRVISTRNRRPMKVVYYEVCGSDKDARAREKYLKSTVGKRYIRNRLKNYLRKL